MLDPQAVEAHSPQKIMVADGFFADLCQLKIDREIQRLTFTATGLFARLSLMTKPNSITRGSMSNQNWTPSSWQKKIATQQPVYPDAAALQDALHRLAKLPPLVTSWEIESLKASLAEAAENQAFLLQVGDCSENLEDCETDSLVRNLKVLMQMSFVLIFGSKKKVIRVGRIAGQYAKPRSNDTETRDGVTLPVYRGDIVNRSAFTESERQPNPELLLRGYERAALTLNFIRGLSGGGFADMHHPENWDLEFASESLHAHQYHEMVDSITGSLQFMEALLGSSIPQSREAIPGVLLHRKFVNGSGSTGWRISATFGARAP